MADFTRNYRWEPAVYEHKAALIGKTPTQVAGSADLLARALIAEQNIYEADFMTVGIDVYNIEAETIGAETVETDAVSCPEIRATIFDIETFDPPGLPDSHAGRFPMLVEAARIARASIGEATTLRIAASGPLTIASKLVGIEPLVMALAMEDPRVTTVLDFCESLSELWIRIIRDSGFDAIVFDSTAAPPVMSPGMYESAVSPYHHTLMELLRTSGQTERPLIIGGNSTPIAGIIAGTGANTLICDFAADARAFSLALGADRLQATTIRRNIDPSIFIANAPPVEERISGYLNDLELFPDVIAGTGILPYDAEPDRVIDFRNRIRASRVD